jgi:hypothetical protein
MGLLDSLVSNRRVESSFSIDSRKKLNFLLVVFKYLIRFRTTTVSKIRNRITNVEELFEAIQKPIAKAIKTISTTLKTS